MMCLTIGNASTRRDPSHERELARLPHGLLIANFCHHRWKPASTFVPLTDSLLQALNVPTPKSNMLGFAHNHAPDIVSSLEAHGCSAMPGLQGPDEITSRDGGLRLAFCSMTPIHGFARCPLEREE
jgi:hypothetical protein